MAQVTENCTPLTAAIDSGVPAMLAVLLKHGADKNVTLVRHAPSLRRRGQAACAWLGALASASNTVAWWRSRACRAQPNGNTVFDSLDGRVKEPKLLLGFLKELCRGDADFTAKAMVRGSMAHVHAV